MPGPISRASGATSQPRSWRDSVSRLAPENRRVFLPFAAALCILLGSLGGVAQDLWYRTYQEGESAFQRRDFVTAEQKFLGAIANRSAPKERGAGVLLISQTRGFFPEYYLALIYAETKQYDRVLEYAATASGYIAANDGARRNRLRTAETAARTALAAPPPPPGDRGRADALLADARTALNAAQFDEARRLVRQAADAGANPTTTIELVLQIDRTQFAALMTAANSASEAENFAAARTAQRRARDLNYDNAGANTLAEKIDNHERFHTLVTASRRALTEGRVAEARENANGAGAPNVSAGRGAADLDTLRTLTADLQRRENYDTAITEARAALARRQIAPARQAALRAQAAAIDGPAVTALIRAIDIQDVSIQLDAAITAKATARVPALADRLGALDPGNPLIGRGQALVAESLGVEQRERLGLRNFYEGRYDAAIAVLSALNQSARPRVGLYLAASKASLSLLEVSTERKDALAREARQFVDPFRNQAGQLNNDVRYLSPAVLKLLGL